MVSILLLFSPMSPSSTHPNPTPNAPTQDQQKADLGGQSIKAASLWRLARGSVSAWVDDYAPSMGAALAYYTLFSLAPLLLLVIAISGLVFGADAARGQVVAQLGGLMGEEGAVAIQGLLKSASHPAQSTAAALIGVVTLTIGATSIFAELQSDLDRIWRAPEIAKPSGIWGLLRARLLSFGLIVSSGFLLLVSLVVSAGLAALGAWWGPWFAGWHIVLQIVNQAVSLIFVTVLFALMYRILPSVRVGWQDVRHGAIATGLLFTLGKFAIGMYLGKAGVASGFGAAGSIVVLVVWVFYSSQIFLLGAEFTWLYAHNHGSHATKNVDSSAAPRMTQPAPLLRHAADHHASLQTRETTARDFAMAAMAWLAYGFLRAIVRRRVPIARRTAVD